MSIASCSPEELALASTSICIPSIVAPLGIPKPNTEASIVTTDAPLYTEALDESLAFMLL